jgi:hypothetical protein
MVGEQAIYQSVTDIAEDYFGPAAPRFVQRLAVNHLGKQPDKITPKDLQELVDWMKLTLAMLTDNEKVITEFSGRLDLLARDCIRGVR